ncbi:MAG TPA: SusD/RagB family nutrient-binding outer membrane lipoprotein [Chitinophagaceae bacterium]
MKKNLVFILLAPVLFLLSCKKMVDGMNTDPNNPQDANAITMLTGVELADAVVQEGELARRSGMWSGYFAGQLFQYQSYYQYNVIANDFNDAWSFVFAATIKNARLMQSKAIATNNRRLAGVAQVLEAHAAGTGAALWGDIPFTQVFNEQYPNPAFDPQAQVYQALQVLLDTAINNLNSSAFLSFASQDIFYQGDNLKWIQAAYTLKARYFMHTKQYALALAAAQTGISSNANSMMMNHIDNPSGSSLYFQFTNDERAGFMNTAGTYAVGIINPAGAKYRGNSKTNETARYRYLYRNAGDINYNNTGGAFNRTTAFPLISYAENLLILAECEARLNGLAAGLTRLNNYRSYLNAGGYLTTQYNVAGTYKYDPYTAADFGTGGIENSNNPFVTYALTANGSGVASGPGATNITAANATTTGYSAPVYRSLGMKLTGNANGDSTTTNPNWAGEGTATTINSTFSGITFNSTTRYVQFDITTATGTSYALQNLSVPITVTGAGTLNAAVAYSTDNWTTFTYLTPSGSAAEAVTSTTPLSVGLAAPVALTANKVSIRIIIYRKAASVGNFASANIGSITFTLSPIPAVSSLTPENALLREILEERYVTFFGQIEGFNDVRRTFKETDVRVPVPPNAGAQLLQRFLYPQSEVDRNTSTPNPIPGIFVPTAVNQ